jgi:hypothetical protein
MSFDACQCINGAAYLTKSLDTLFVRSSNSSVVLVLDAHCFGKVVFRTELEELAIPSNLNASAHGQQEDEVDW